MGALPDSLAAPAGGHMPQIDRVQSVIDAQKREFPRLDYSAMPTKNRLPVRVDFDVQGVGPWWRGVLANATEPIRLLSKTLVFERQS
jgi:hypothetical protein